MSFLETLKNINKIDVLLVIFIITIIIKLSKNMLYVENIGSVKLDDNPTCSLNNIIENRDMVEQLDALKMQQSHISDDSNDKLKLSLFYTLWCGFSRNFFPEWEKIKLHFGSKLIFEEHDCDKASQSICVANNVNGYPTIILTKLDGVKISYPDRQPRTAELIIKFINDNN